MTRTILALAAHALLMGPPEGAPALDEEAASELLSTESDTSDEARYQRTIEQLTYGVTIGDVQPKEAIPILEAALAGLPQFTPQFANDPKALVLRAEAYVSLSRAYLTVRDEAKAREAMDEGIRTAPFGEELPADAYGPKVKKLWTKRNKEANSLPRQDVVVKCWVKCRIYLNERIFEHVDASDPVPEDEFAVETRFVALTAGTYRLWVEAEDGSSDPLIAEFEPPDPDADPREFIFGTKPEPVPEEPMEGPKPAPVKKPVPVRDPLDHEKRLLPRPVEISAMAVGVGLIVSGAVLFAINGKCTNEALSKDAVPADGLEACPSLWATDVAGIALMGSGAGLSAVGTVLISIDEVRGAKNRKSAQVNIGWKFRF